MLIQLIHNEIYHRQPEPWEILHRGKCISNVNNNFVEIIDHRRIQRDFSIYLFVQLNDKIGANPKVVVVSIVINHYFNTNTHADDA